MYLWGSRDWTFVIESPAAASPRPPQPLLLLQSCPRSHCSISESVRHRRFDCQFLASHPVSNYSLLLQPTVEFDWRRFIAHKCICHYYCCCYFQGKCWRGKWTIRTRALHLSHFSPANVSEKLALFFHHSLRHQPPRFTTLLLFFFFLSFARTILARSPSHSTPASYGASRIYRALRHTCNITPGTEVKVRPHHRHTFTQTMVFFFDFPTCTPESFSWSSRPFLPWPLTSTSRDRGPCVCKYFLVRGRQAD